MAFSLLPASEAIPWGDCCDSYSPIAWSQAASLSGAGAFKSAIDSPVSLSHSCSCVSAVSGAGAALGCSLGPRLKLGNCILGSVITSNLSASLKSARDMPISLSQAAMLSGSSPSCCRRCCSAWFSCCNWSNMSVSSVIGGATPARSSAAGSKIGGGVGPSEGSKPLSSP